MNVEVLQNDPSLLRLGRKVTVFETIGSTQDEAHASALDGEAEGAVIVAESQTRGRGRHGRSWHSPSGKNILASILLRPPIAPREAQILTFAAACGVCEAVTTVSSLPARIKWPNDVTLSGLKLAGILTEAYSAGGRIDHAVLGIGLNVNMAREEWPEDLIGTATSLSAEAGKPFDRIAVLSVVLRGVDRWYARFLSEGPEPVLRAWRGLCDTLGRDVRVEMKDGIIEGRAEAVDGSGALLVRGRDGKIVVVVSGEVIHLR